MLHVRAAIQTMFAVFLLTTGCQESAAPCVGVDLGCAGPADAARADVAAPSPDAKKPSKALLPTWKDDPCANQAKHKPGYVNTVGRWTGQDSQILPPPGGLLVIGSSSVRYWKSLLREFSAWRVTQRGYGGSLLWDTVAHTAKIVLPYKPRAVLVYAGTNDVSRGTAPDEVVTGYRCLVQKLRQGLGDVHLIFIGITPNPARWSQWSKAAQVNAAVKALTATAPGLHYVDIPAAFLKQGQPPPAKLFVSDKLHLNDEGYKLWNSVIRPVLQKAAPPKPYTTPAGQPATGSRALMDFGPSNPDDGNHSKSPDGQGQHWNNWHATLGGATTLTGERVALTTTLGKATPWRVVLGGQFSCNGLQNGGLKLPAPGKLGKLAVATATQDYFFVSSRQSLSLTGLHPGRRYRLRLFASRAWADHTRVTRYVAYGGGAPATRSLTTSGKDIGSDGQYDGNDATIVTMDNLQPDKQGKLHLTLEPTTGKYGYISLMELTVK